MNKMKIENVVIDSKIDLFNSKIVAVIGAAGSGKSQFLQHLYHFYDGLKFAMLYENKDTMQCFSNERTHSEFEYSNKKVAIFDGGFNQDRSFMNMVRNKVSEKNVHKIFISAHTYKSVREVEEIEEQYIVGGNLVRRSRYVDSVEIKGGKELAYSADTILKIEKNSDGLFKISVTKSRSSQIQKNSYIPFFATLADEYSKQPLYPNRFLRQHLLKYNKFDLSVYPMDNFKDIFNI